MERARRDHHGDHPPTLRSGSGVLRMQKKFMHIFLFTELFYVLILSKYITELLGAGVRGSNIRVDSSKDPQT